MAFFDNFIRLCVNKGVTPSVALDDIGIDRSAHTRWKNGQKPTATTIAKVADYFGVDRNELMYGTYKPNNFDYVSAVDLISRDEVKLIKAWREADERAKELVAYALKDAGFTYTAPGVRKDEV